MTALEQSLTNNINRYPWYQAAGSFLPWLPLFFLFFYQYVSLSDALKVSVAYYLSVFFLEVPSGYLSDKFGRRKVLIAASVAAVLAYLTFLVARDFVTLVIGQIFLAGFFAFKSGSDNSLLYDSLVILQREDEYAAREAHADKWALLTMAAAGLMGGVSGLYSLTIPYVLSLLGALVSLVLAFQFVEPPQQEQAKPFFQQLKTCLAYLKNPYLLWLFGFFVLGYSLEHVPAEFNQPFVKLLQTNWFGDFDKSALVSGVVIACSMLTGALGATISMSMTKRYGVNRVLLAGIAMECLIIAAMAILLHPLILLLVMFRNFPMALTHAPMLGAIAPRIDSAQRATYLSIQSLVGRLGFSTLLYCLSTLVDGAGVGVSDSGAGSAIDTTGDMQWPELATLLRTSLAVGLAGLVVLLISGKFRRNG